MAFYNSVETAAKWLDGVEPDWYNKINEQTLSMKSGVHCVLAQVFGSYYDGCRKFDIPIDGQNAFGLYASEAKWSREIHLRKTFKQLTPLQQAEKNIVELENKLQEERAKLEALRNPEISVTLSKSDWKLISDTLHETGICGDVNRLMATIDKYIGE